MQALGVDVLISAPQKGWTGPSCAGLVMLGKRGVEDNVRSIVARPPPIPTSWSVSK